MFTASKRTAFLLIILLVAQVPAGAWGNDGHRWLNRIAVNKLPESVPKFVRKSGDRMAYLGPEPDRWRNAVSEPQLKWSQEPDHFIDFERLPADFGDLPNDRYLFTRKLYELRAKALQAGADQKTADLLLPEKVGLQPYITMEVFGRLKVAFREYRHAKRDGRGTEGIEHNIVLYAGWMGHYVADGSQPLHTTVQFNGWIGPNPNGYTTAKDFHWDYESRFVKDNFNEIEIARAVNPAVQLQNPFKDYVAYLRHSQSLVEKLYQLEKAGGIKEKGSQEARDFTRARLAEGAQMQANLIYSAWMESAVDPPDPYAPKPPVPAVKAAQPAVSPSPQK